MIPDEKQDSEKTVRSDQTRKRILSQARRLFGELGFENTTIRAIASAAKIHPSMVMRYYHSKEELFATAATVNFRLPDLVGIEHGKRGEALMEHILEQWEGESTGRELQVLLRAAGTHDLARTRFVEYVQQQAVPAIKKVLAKDHQEKRMGLILIQIAGLVVSRYLFAYTPVVAMKRHEIIRTIGPILQDYIAGPLK